MQRSEPAARETRPATRREIKDRGFRELFSAHDIGYYGASIIVYLVLGLIFRDKVLNIGIGPLFFVAWIWVVPPLWERARRWWSSR